MNNSGVRLVWDQEDQPEETACKWQVAEMVYPCPVYDYDSLFVPENNMQSSREPGPVNRLVHGDNLSLLRLLRQEGWAGKIDMIYIDPPYLSQGRYASRVEVGEKDARHFIARQVFDDSWGNNLSAYLNHMFVRLQLMHDLLSPSGSIFIHLDWHVSHYIKLLLDSIFSPQSFINEIVWCYGGGSGAKRHFHRKHDVILWYAKGRDYIFNPQYRPYTPGTRQRGLTRVKGDKYHLHREGAIMQDWWTDINKILSPTAYENLKFPTQKPLALMQRLISTASLPGSVVADFYSGSGTLAQACQQMGRQWIACDNSPVAIHTTMQRLIKEGGRPFSVEKISNEQNYEVLPLTGITSYAYNHKQNINRIAISLEDCEISILSEQKIESPASALAFWSVGNQSPSGFSSNLQILRSKTSYQKPLPLQINLLIPVDAGGQLAVKAYDLWGNEYYSLI